MNGGLKGKMNKNIKLKLIKFYHIDFIGAVFLYGLMVWLVWIGNPRIAGFGLNWHHIPELIANYLVGIWCFDICMRKSKVLLAYSLAIFLTMSLFGTFDVIALLVAGLIGFPFVLGYFVRSYYSVRT